MEINARTADGARWILYLNSSSAGDYDFPGLAYGDNRFIAVTTDGTTLYSLDKGTTFKTGTSISQLGGVDLHVKDFQIFARCVYGSRRFNRWNWRSKYPKMK